MSFLRRRVVQPVIDLLRIGATPERLAWSLAVGAVVGMNPLLGSTTALSLGVALALRLNLVGSQLISHAVYPLELMVFPVFVKLGSLLFGTPGLPLKPMALFEVARRHPWETTRRLWTWEWHALVVWAIFAVVAAPLLALVLRPVLERMLNRLHHELVMEK